MFKHACSIGLEGVVSKVRDSKYTSGRTNDWAKKACAQREMLMIAGSRSTAANGTACIWLDAEAAIRFTLASVDHGFDKDNAKRTTAAPQAANQKDPALQ